MELESANRRIAQNRKVFDRAAKKAHSALEKNDLNSAIAWSKIAAHFAFVRHPGIYTSPVLENTLIEVAQRIKQQPPDVSGAFYLKNKPKNIGKMRFLHVVTESYGAGGHTPFVARWIENTLDNSVHSLVATGHNRELPSILKDAVNESGGWYSSLTELSENFVEQALLLRLLAQNWADIIVLLIHPFDPIPTVAFGVEGGPPVVLCNHADHAFWLGASVADVVVDYHPSGGALSVERRGTVASKLLPIPLTKSVPPPQKSDVRSELGFGKNETVLLTIGRDEKFYPFDGFDFFEVMVGFLKRHSNVRLVAVGPPNIGRWRQASAEVDGKIEVLGTVDRDELEKYYAAADVYVASFPCGSGTSLLEAAMHNLPIVGLHLSQLPHLSLQDDVGFTQLGVHQSTVDGFKASLESTITNCQNNRQKAELVRENVEREHCSPGWNRYLNDILQSLPSQHSIHNPKVSSQSTDYVDAYWENLSSHMMGNELPEHSMGRLIRVYSENLSKADMVNGQAENLMFAFLKVDSFKRSRQFFSSFREFVDSALARRSSA